MGKSFRRFGQKGIVRIRRHDDRVRSEREIDVRHAQRGVGEIPGIAWCEDVSDQKNDFSIHIRPGLDGRII
jgi:hypothetical protein